MDNNETTIYDAATQMTIAGKCAEYGCSLPPKASDIEPCVEEIAERTVSVHIRISRSCPQPGYSDELEVEEFATNQQIIILLKSMIASDHFQWKTRLVVMKAIHFKGRWEKKFDPVSTKNRRFYVERNTTKDVPTICIKRELRVEIISDSRATLIEIPYQSEKISVIIIVPKKKDELEKISENPYEAIRRRSLQQGCFRETRLLLPQINIKSAPNVGAAFDEVQMANILENKLDFNEIFRTLTNDNEDLRKKLIEVGVDEEGEEEEESTKSGLASAIFRCGFQRPVYRVDRPFYYQVVCSILGVTLFAGCYPARD